MRPWDIIKGLTSAEIPLHSVDYEAIKFGVWNNLGSLCIKKPPFYLDLISAGDQPSEVIYSNNVRAISFLREACYGVRNAVVGTPIRL